MRKTAIAAAGFVLALALGGCGETTTGTASPVFDNAQNLAQAAKTETSKSKSSKFTFEADMMGQKMTGKGEGRYAGADSAIAMTMDAAGQQMEMRFVDQTIYIKMPQGTPGANPAKPWMKITPGGNDPMSKMLGDMGQMAEQNDPSKMLEQIEKSGTITKSEETQLAGAKTTHYWIKLDLAKLAGQAPAGMSKQSLEQMRKAGVDSLPMQLWMNQDNLPVKVEMDMTAMIAQAAKQAGQQAPQGKAQMSMRYTDWGAKVAVEAPPTSQVGEFNMPN
ncbi:MAG: hypothetical protein GEU98_16340 [Pseudonocardiaceae bacterium]|nr:hypothetical protein [Pseudonocardiaceae bacterium]